MKLFNYLLIFVGITASAQTVSVNDTENTPSQLVDVLLDNACVEVSNVSASSTQSVAYFNNNGGNFPIDEGIIIRSGKAKLSEGNYSGQNLSSTINNSSDPYLEEINNSSGQSSTITDVAFLEFDFVPLSSDFNFNFLFASNEYGEWQCASSDTFAFLLTNLSTGEVTNLAVVPNTEVPVSVRNIKDESYNPSCESSNEEYFESYQVDDASNSTINMRGYTAVMNASATIVPGQEYKIKLVIGDSNDANFDSAIFLSAGSFTTGVDLGPDQALCSGALTTIGTDLDPQIYSHTWSYNGEIISGENQNFLNVENLGNYTVNISRNEGSCVMTDEIIISSLEVENPANLEACFSETGEYFYNLSTNTAEALGLDENYKLHYFASNEDMLSGNAIAENELENFSSSGSQTIYLKVEDLSRNLICNTVYTFDLLVSQPIEVDSPENIEVCTAPPANAVVNLNQGNISMISQSASDYELSYFTSLEDAETNNNAIQNPGSFSIPPSTASLTIYVRIENVNSLGCFIVENFQVILNQPPAVDELEDVVKCSSYILPELENGNYFTGANGTGQALFAGDEIISPGIYYIFNGPDENGCTNESSFRVTLVDQYIIPTEYCGSFQVPQNDFGKFYTAPGGANGEGEEIPFGTSFTTSQTIYFYAEVDGVFCRDEAFNITVFPLPEVDTPEDIVTCEAYILPELEHGSYFTQANGGGQELNSGTAITTSKNLYVFADDGTCTNQHAFRVEILPDFEDVTACGSYTLPNLEIGGFYTAPNGAGENIPEASVITASQTIFYFAETTTSPNCTANNNFSVTINPIPQIDALQNVLICETETYILPNLNHGQFFTQPNRGGIELFPGDEIDESITIYINNLENSCTNETSFEIEKRPLPEVENFTDVFVCSSYELPTLENGTYYTGTNASGELLNPGDIINTTQTIYIYNEWEDLTYCSNQDAFTVHVEGVEVGSFEDIVACDSYVLPSLTEGKYYTESGGEGQRLYPGTAITTSQEIFVYAKQGNRFVCEDEASFNVHISETPSLDDFSDVEVCGSYTLPALNQDEFDVAYYSEAGGNDMINPLDYEISTIGWHTIYVYATAKNNEECTAETSFTVLVHPLLNLNIEDAVICSNLETGEIDSPAYLSSGLDPNQFDVEWYLNNELVHIGANFEAIEAGTYTVKTYKLDPEVGANCNYAPTTVTVTESAKPTVRAEVTEDFANIAVINVEILNGLGAYEFSLNNGSYQDSNEFYDVPSGTHTIKVRGKNADCGETTIIVEVLKFPKFFTPNNDGFNDRWNIEDLANNPEAVIELYDRYGKLLHIFKPSGAGWDGKFRGKDLSPADYWFKVNYEIDGVEKEFKGHFSLKR